MLRYLIILFTLLMTAVNVRAQCERPAVGGNRILTDDSDQQTFPDGSTVKFRCSSGYVPVRISASRSITCTGTQWSKLEFLCKKKSCGNPGEIHHGKYLFPEGILFGATITAQCNEGFWLVGQPSRNCRETGWDGRAPVCKVAKCLKPPSITNGIFDPVEDSYDYREAVIYSCKRGLDLIGPSEITCSGDGTFQPPPPRCLFVSCESPKIPNAVRIEGRGPPYKYNNFIRYQCNKGYRMEGSDFLTCKEDGWNPPPPQCTVITCLEPPAIDNGLFDPLKELYEYGQTVTYSCNEGFRLRGASTIACTDDGTFQTSPQCQEISCDPPAIPNAVIDESLPRYRYGVSVQIRCNKGYRIVGSDELMCWKYGWIPPLPKCIEVTCDVPNISNAVVVGRKASSYNYNMSIRYQCDKGYRMEGSDLLTCEEKGWNPPPPKCNIVTCLKPPVINNGHFNPLKEKYEYGQTVTYLCKKGFRLQGASTISCSDEGTFQPSPQCLEVTCDEPQIKHAYIIEGKSTYYGYKSSVRVQCKTLYKMEGSEYLTCEEDGWNPPPPRCHFNLKFLLNQKICSLVNMCSSALTTEETSPKSMY
ncbi:C4b-binding protein alpha chain [Pangasianodon hypophthalmus]|uniref:C4b-binding protein alpha chain n=1 Tax=Pangasianodon hypophthalmus TaxID=310915 RepID=UPI002306FD72|nr:C4b-binding protein alpha chain [Pangasianodon hypophthalmus]